MSVYHNSVRPERKTGEAREVDKPAMVADLRNRILKENQDCTLKWKVAGRKSKSNQGALTSFDTVNKFGVGLCPNPVGSFEDDKPGNKLAT